MRPCGGAGLDAANSAAAEEAAKRGVAWDMGKQHALTLMMESVAARSANVSGMYGPAVNGGYLGGAVQVDPGFSQLTPRLLSALETEI